jgi:hypothetical protein
MFEKEAMFLICPAMYWLGSQDFPPLYYGKWVPVGEDNSHEHYYYYFDVELIAILSRSANPRFG